MIRLLTAALLVASFGVVADTEVPHTFTDGTPAKASEVNENNDALEAAIDAIPSDVITAVTSADLDMDGNRVLFSNVYSRLADLPSASANHGMFAHVHETGEAYFAHAGEWIQIAKQSSSLSGLSCTTDQSIVYRDGAWVCSSPERVAGSFFEQGFRTVYCSDGKKVSALIESEVADVNKVVISVSSLNSKGTGTWFPPHGGGTFWLKDPSGKWTLLDKPCLECNNKTRT